jgi:hypothetical protein
VELRIPGGADLLSIFGVDLSDLAHGPGDTAVDDVTPERLDQAIDSMARGHLEYVGLHEGPTFLQAAGEGAGPYVIELHPDAGDAYVHVPEGVTPEAVRYALHGFLQHDPTWMQAFPWQPATLAPPPTSGGVLGRLFGRR